LEAGEDDSEDDDEFALPHLDLRQPPQHARFEDAATEQKDKAGQILLRAMGIMLEQNPEFALAMAEATEGDDDESDAE